MSIVVTEKMESRRLTTGKNATMELICNVIGTDDDAQAKIAVENFTPAAWGSIYKPPLLYRQQIQLEVLGPLLWIATVRYDTTGTEPLSALDSFEFDTSGGTQHITQSIETVATYGDAPADFDGAIGVNDKSVDGVDIVVPVFNFSETHRFAEISNYYKGAIFNVTGKVNRDPFRGFAPGEVLFLGATGNKRDNTGETPWELAYRFSALANRNDIYVGSIGPITKRGWEYMWVRYADADDNVSKTLIKYPLSVHIEQVYQTVDFSLLGIG